MSLTIGAGSRALLKYQGILTEVKKLQTTLFRITPKLGKLLVFLLFLLNIRSWPLVWHCKSQSSLLIHIHSRSQVRVFREVFAIRIRHTLIRAQMLFLSPMAGLELEDNWLESISPIGANPFEMAVHYRSWASE